MATAYSTNLLAKEAAYELVYSENYSNKSPTDVFVDTDPGSPWPTGGDPNPPDDNESTKAFSSDALVREQVADWMHGFMTGGGGPDNTWSDPSPTPTDGPTDPSPPADPATAKEIDDWVLMFKDRIAYRAMWSNDAYAKYSNIKAYVSDMTELLLVGVRLANGA